ncbi:MAG: hypothetical protein HQ509_04700 [Candidatus Marinimicrobia bacterium]|nr:hypothetical protein [Candidatus Neomarinimicrobiota bacterium]
MSKTDKINHFLQIFESKACNITETCKAIGISRSTYYSWLNDVEFEDQIMFKRDSMVDIVESKLMELIDDGNITAIIFFLKTIGRGRGLQTQKLFRGTSFTDLYHYLENEPR